MTNLHCSTKLTEFGPLSPELKQTGITSIFSKIFKFSQVNSSNEQLDTPTLPSATTSTEDDSVSDPTWTVLNTDNEDLSSSPSTTTSSYQYIDHGRDGRNIRKVLRRVSNLLASRHKNNVVYNDTSLRQYWMPDEVSKECYDCGERFTLVRRKHHCRVCGQIFCSQCCKQEVPGKIIGCSENLRVCTYCCKVILAYLQESDLSVDLKAVQEDLLHKFGDIQNNDQEQDTLSVTGVRPSAEVYRRKVSVIYQEEKFVDGGFQSNTTWYDNENMKKSEHASLGMLIKEMTSDENQLLVYNVVMEGVKHESCFTGSHLIDWLISHKKTSSRTHSIAIGQVLLDAKYIENITSPSSVDFADDSTTYKFIELSQIDNPTKDASENSHTRLGYENVHPLQSGFHLDLNIQKNVVHMSRQPQKATNTKDKKKSTPLIDVSNDEVLNEFVRLYRSSSLELVPISWASINVSNLRDNHEEISVFRSLSDTFGQHLQNAVNQLLSLENLSLSWASVIVPLAERALAEIKLDFNKSETIHIGHYIQVKKLPGGERKDCQLIGGIICSKDVAHREMCTRVANPRILLLQCAVVYHRTERLMSLDPVILQEEEYLRKAAARIIALEPDIVLVHRNVSRLAQESLNARGITLVLNVKTSVMERVARCTNADIVTSVDAHFVTVQLGTCRSFYTRKYALKDGITKTLMCFEGCAFPQLGCTILLRGAAEGELKKLKKVVQAVVFMYYNAKLEKSFLMDEFAKPPTLSFFTFVGEIVSPKRTILSPNDDFYVSHYVTREKKTQTATTTNVVGKREPETVAVSRSEEKRTSVKSIVDSSDDPLQAHLKAAKNETQTTKVENIADNVPLAEVPMKENKFKAALRDTVLSYSPFVEFNIPFLETKVGLNCELRKYFPKEIYYYDRAKKMDLNRSVSNDPTSAIKSSDLSGNFSKPPHPFVTAKLKEDIADERVQTLLAYYRAQGGRITYDAKSVPTMITKRRKISETKLTDVDVFDPRNHQRLSVLFCSFSHESNNAPEYCVSPWIVNMDFYDHQDIPLGSFLEKYCFRRSYMCPSNTCETPMLFHERRFVHDTSCIHVTMKEIDSLVGKNDHPILMWSSCTVCKIVTPIVAMSNDTWNLSFAKYLELRFHAGKYGCRADTNKSCDHSLHQDYCQYFYRDNIVASFEFMHIVLWEVSLPPPIIKIEPVSVRVSSFLDEVKKWTVTGHEIFSSILEKLHTLEADNPVTIQGLNKHLSNKQAAFKQQVDDIQVKLTLNSLCDSKDIEISGGDVRIIEDMLVLMKKYVAESLAEWNMILTKLEGRKREDKQKHKISTSDSIEGKTSTNTVTTTPDVFVTYNEDQGQQTKDTRECRSVSESGSCDSSNTDASRSELLDKNEDVDNGTPSIGVVALTCDPVGTVAQTLAPDKMTVKALLAQFLPNTFQQPGALLFNPLHPEEHYVIGNSVTVPLVIYDSEPSSIIAYALGSYQYLTNFEEMAKKKATISSEYNARTSLSKKDSSDANLSNLSFDSSHHSENEDSSRLDKEDDTKVRSGKTTNTNHIEVNFSDSTATYTVKVYFAQQFKEMRELVFPSGEEAYLRSLSRCVPWAAHGGKSGSTFCKTKDDRLILKEIPRLEVQPFLEFANNYFSYVLKCHNSQQPTLLVKIIGVYRVKFKNTTTSQTLNLLVMENLFYMKDIRRKFDLKGSVRNRLVNTKSNHEGELVLLDENLINMTCSCPLYIYPHSKTVLMKAINSDVTFLSGKCVMDYSLLVGLDETRQVLVVGIIDYIRTFTWDKKIETMVKKSGILGGQGKVPTIVSPLEYKDRFIAAMHKYFLAVPDQWQRFGEGIDY